MTIELRDTFTGTAGNAAGNNIIGKARVLNMEHNSESDGTYGNADDTYKVSIFDVQMFTILELATAQSIPAGSIIVGGTSGAEDLLKRQLLQLMSICIKLKVLSKMVK